MDFKKVDSKFFKSLFDSWKVDPAKMPPRAKPSFDLSETTVIDLTDYNYISLFDLVGLYLAIDYAQAVIGITHVRFNGLGPAAKFNVLPLEEYNYLRRQSLDKLADDKKVEYKIAHNVYSFVAFCHHFGLFDALSLQRQAGTVVIEGISDEILSNLHTYGGAKTTGSRVLRLIPIRASDDLDTFRISSSIKNWLQSLSPDITSAPVFSDGEFSHVLGYQLGLNIMEHSGLSWRGEYGANGAIVMRVIPSSSFGALKASLPKTSQVLNISSARGVLEICVCDRGNGIVNTLRDSYSTFKSKYGFKDSEKDEDIVAFAFDELGTRKNFSERIGGVHALHRILKCVTKYNGLMYLRTAGQEYIYDASIRESFRRNETGLGIYPTSINSVSHLYGTQYQIILPLCSPTTQTRTILRRQQKDRLFSEKDPLPDFRIVQVGAHYVSGQDQETNLKLGILRQSILTEPASVAVAYDFGNTSFSEDDIVTFLASQKPVLHTHCCTAIEVDPKLAKLLREREKLNIEKEDVPPEDRQLFYVLSVKHRVITVVDTERNVSWFGLGRYQLDEALSAIMCSPSGIDRDEIDNLTQDVDREIVDLYLHANDDFFTKKNVASREVWFPALKESDLYRALEAVVRLRLPEILQNSGSLENRGFYKLPSRTNYYDKFVQSAPLLQSQDKTSQIADWLCAAIFEVIGGQESVLLLTTTAPAELAARAIASNLSGRTVHVLNLGYYSALDAERLVDRRDWKSVPTIIIADIIDKQKTVNQLLTFAQDQGFDIKAFISVLRLVDGTAMTSRTLYWDPVPGNPDNQIPRYFIGDFSRPKEFDEEEIKQKKENDIYYVEPYSLEPFSHSSLSGKYEERQPKEKINRGRIQLLEEAGALRTGHWVYGSHHFFVTTCIRKLLTDEIIGGEICGEIINVINNYDIDHVLLPLHSHICDIVPRLISGTKISSKRKVSFTYCLSTKVLAARSFYVLPKPIKQQIDSFCKAINGKARKGLRFLILDDAVATGRTFETLHRALVMQGRKSAREHKLIHSPIEHVHAYAIIDRQGRAKSTLLTSIDSISLFGDSYIAEAEQSMSFSFKYQRWLDVDMPVEEKEACEICKEREELLSLLTSEVIPTDHSSSLEIENRLEQTRAQSTEIPSFYSHVERKLPAPIDLGRVKGAETAELVLWEMYNLLHRGTPFWLLISEYNKISILNPIVIAENDSERNVQYLKTEIGRLFFRNWERLNSHWSGNAWVDSLKDEILRGSDVAKDLLWEAGRVLALAQPQSRYLLYEVFGFAIESMISITEDSDPSGIRRENVGIGLVSFGLLCNFYLSKDRNVNDGQKQEIIKVLLGYLEVASTRTGKTLLTSMYIDEIASAIMRADRSDNFIPALITLLNHTIRPGRHAHPHLLPALLSLLIKGKVNPAECKLIKDILIDLKFCLEIIEKRYFNIFDKDSRDILPVFKSMLSNLYGALDNYIIAADPEVKRLALLLLKHYPHQTSSSIYRSLKDTQVKVVDLLTEVKAACESHTPPIDVEMDHSLANIESIFVIAPNVKTLKEILLNYTVSARVDASQCPSPKIGIGLRYVYADSLKKLVLEVSSNFNTPNSSYANVMLGPGIKEADTRLFKLFRIKLEPNTLNESNYTLRLGIEMCIGFPH